MDPLIEVAINLARETGRILVDYYQHSQLNTSLKPDGSLVTEADLAADQFLAQAIHERFPNDDLLSEEGKTTWSPGAASNNTSAVWIIDPLDGTTNFSLGLPIWGVLLARLVDGLPVLAVAHFPLLDECYVAQRGQGVWLNQHRIQVAPSQVEGKQPFFACCSRTFRRYQIKLPYKVRILGSSAYTFCLLARGAALIGFEVTPKIWDIAGQWLIVNEAGGVIDTLNGIDKPLPLLPQKSYAALSYPTLAAASPDLLSLARQSIQPKSA